jgi:hypothetical protein
LIPLEIRAERRSLVERVKESDVKVLEAEADKKQQATELASRIQEYQYLSATVGAQLTNVESEYADSVREHQEIVRRYRERTLAFVREMHEPWSQLHRYFGLEIPSQSLLDTPSDALDQIAAGARLMADEASSGMPDEERGVLSRAWRMISSPGLTYS